MAFTESIVCKAKEISDGSVEQLLKELFSHLASLPEYGNYWKWVLGKRDMTNSKSDFYD